MGREPRDIGLGGCRRAGNGAGKASWEITESKADIVGVWKNVPKLVPSTLAEGAVGLAGGPLNFGEAGCALWGNRQRKREVEPCCGPDTVLPALPAISHFLLNAECRFHHPIFLMSKLRPEAVKYCKDQHSQSRHV